MTIMKHKMRQIGNTRTLFCFVYIQIYGNTTAFLITKLLL